MFLRRTTTLFLSLATVLPLGCATSAEDSDTMEDPIVKSDRSDPPTVETTYAAATLKGMTIKFEKDLSLSDKRYAYASAPITRESAIYQVGCHAVHPTESGMRKTVVAGSSYVVRRALYLPTQRVVFMKLLETTPGTTGETELEVLCEGRLNLLLDENTLIRDVCAVAERETSNIDIERGPSCQPKP